MNFSILAERVRYFKETEGGQNAMCEIMEEIVNEEKRKIILNMLSENFSLETISRITNLNVEEIQSLMQSKPV